MNRTSGKYIVSAAFIVTAAIIAYLFFNPHLFLDDAGQEARQTRVIIPNTVSASGDFGTSKASEQLAYEDIAVSKVALAEGETLITVATQDFDGDPQDEQILAYRKKTEADSPVLIDYVDFDEHFGGYRRVWTTESSVTRPRTVSLYVKDLIGDRSICVLVAGLNNQGEQTLTVLRKNPVSDYTSSSRQDTPFSHIAELHVDGSIIVQEEERSQAYQMGLASGTPFAISTYGRDYESSNILDQIEITYTYDKISGEYVRTGTARIPGIQIEQRRVRELLDGTPGKFESFISGLWYFSATDGSASEDQYIYFDTEKREIIFYSENMQEVFNWQNSHTTRYGLYINTQNVTVTTLRRMVDIELQSIDSIRIKTFEDIRLKIGISGRWDGIYRKAASGENNKLPDNEFSALIDASFEGSLGLVQFKCDGTYQQNMDSVLKGGSYAFFMLENKELLEMRETDAENNTERIMYQVEHSTEDELQILILKPVRIGTRGIQDLHEEPIRMIRTETAALTE